MKYKAYQVAPEYQESPLDVDDFENMDGLIVYGNAHTTPDFDNVIDGLTMGEFDPTSYPEGISIDDMRNLDMLASKFCDSLNPQKVIALALSVWTGSKWEYKCIKGSAQSDWQYVYYRADLWTDKELEYFETEYFNTGEEWRVIDEEGEEVYYYTHEWSDIYKTRELAKNIGCNVQDLTLYAFDGWERTPRYKEV